MPADQLEKTVESHLGVGWKDSLLHFDPEPLAAASIGQVHLAKVKDPDDSANVLDVCMKIQYPGVAKSIHSDIDNLMRLVSLTDILPKGLYVEHAVAVAKEELTLECDYEYERDSQIHMANLLRGSFLFIYVWAIGYRRRVFFYSYRRPALARPEGDPRVVRQGRDHHRVRAGRRDRQHRGLTAG